MACSTYTTGRFLEFQGQGWFFELKNVRLVDTYHWNSEEKGEGGRGVPERTDKSVKVNELMTLLTTTESKIQDKH